MDAVLKLQLAQLPMRSLLGRMLLTQGNEGERRRGIYSVERWLGWWERSGIFMKEDDGNFRRILVVMRIIGEVILCRVIM